MFQILYICTLIRHTHTNNELSNESVRLKVLCDTLKFELVQSDCRKIFLVYKYVEFVLRCTIGQQKGI